MSLVAYGSSDESEEEKEIDTRCSAQITTCIQREKIESVSTKQNSDVEFYVNKKENAKLDGQSEKPLGSLFQSLPQPKQGNVIFGSSDQDELESHPDVPVLALLPEGVPQSSNNLFPMGTSKKIGSGPVKITLPSLSQFNEEDEPIKKKIKPSLKGSGLFAVLPAPKNVKSRETQQPLIPHVLTKKVTPAPNNNVSRVGKHSLLEVDYESEDDEDFFSLNTVNKVLDEKDADLSTGSLKYTVKPISSSIADYTEKTGYNITTEEEHSATLPSLANTSRLRTTSLTPGCSKGNHYNYMNEGISINNSTVESTPQEQSTAFASEDLQLNAEAMQRLCGRRSKKNQEPVEIIDVNGTEIMPDPSEWLVKQLSEEQPKMHSHSHKRNDGPTTQQRRKHQITYLAFQAKENELELKNQWSQNRMTRKQTQSKYGF